MAVLLRRLRLLLRWAQRLQATPRAQALLPLPPLPLLLLLPVRVVLRVPVSL
jgi:hypothetical protein